MVNDGPGSTRFAATDDGDVAFRVMGNGPTDLVVIPGWVSNIEIMMESPEVLRMLDRFAGIGRVIFFDKRGTGLSDRTTHAFSLEERVEDVVAVMDAVGSPRAAVIGWVDGAAIAAAFAVAYPDRVDRVVLGFPVASPPSMRGAIEDHAWTDFDIWQGAIAQAWGTGVLLPLIAPSMIGHARFEEWWKRLERSITSKAATAMLASVRGADIERLLPRITVPTLVVNRTGFPFISRSAARELADSLPDGRYVEVEGADVLPYIGDTDALFGAVEEFLTGTVRGSLMGRYLAATLFTDIVDSTPQSRVLGDTEWRDTLDAHDRLVRRNLIRFSGTEIDTTGDGFFALFDSALSAIKCAIATIPEVTEFGLHIRCAVHVAEFDQRGRTPVGIGAHVGARLLSIAAADEVVVSSAVRDVLLGTHLDFEHRGSFALKGVPGSWEVFSAREASHAGPVGRSG